MQVMWAGKLLRCSEPGPRGEDRVIGKTAALTPAEHPRHLSKFGQCVLVNDPRVIAFVSPEETQSDAEANWMEAE